MTQLVPAEDAYRRRMEELAIKEGRMLRPSLTPQVKRSFNRARAERIADLAARQMPPCDIAAFLGVSRTLIYQYARRYGIALPSGDPGTPGPRVNKRRYRRQRAVAELHRAGMSHTDIAARLGTRRQTVSVDLWCIEKYGVPTQEEVRTGVRKPRQP